MSNTLPRIVYMGSPDFALAPLQQLLADGFPVVGVITAPDRPAGRGKKLRQSAVKSYILEHHPELEILQPNNLKDPVFLEELKALKPELQIVVAFRMLPALVWQIPALGTFNLHASLLPQYRGAAPINHAIINGEKESGVSTFFIDEKIDTGRILFQEKIKIGEKETAGELHDRLMKAGAQLVSKTARLIAEGKCTAQSQETLISDTTELKPAPKIFKEHCRINWDEPGQKIFNLIRGLSPYPAAYTHLEHENGEKLICKIYAADFEKIPHEHDSGSILTDGKNHLDVAVKDGLIHVYKLQQEGKRKMDTRDFLAGFRFAQDKVRFF